MLEKHEPAERVFEIERFSDILIKINMLLGKTICRIFWAYAPQDALTGQQKEAFWELMEKNS